METHVRSRSMEVCVIVKGIRQPIYRRLRDNQPFVAGLWGQSFVLEVRNNTPGRVEILSSVDGRNTLQEEEANLRTSRGMVVGPYDVWCITGWRIDDNTTAEFVFTDPSQSVEHMVTGQNKNAGVFGFALFHEYVVQQSAFRGATRGGGGVTRGSSLESYSGDMGTGIGSVQTDRVGKTTFIRLNSEPEVLTIQYRSREWLERTGIIISDEPQAFPGSQTGYGSLIR